MGRGDEDPDLAILMAVAYRGVADRIAAGMRAGGHEAVTPSWGYVFRAVGSGRLSLTSLAQALGVTKQTVAKVVDDMEEAGYLERLPSLTDRRMKLLVLTDRGRDAAARARRVSREIEREMVAAAGAESVRGLRQALGAFVERSGGGEDAAAGRARPVW